MTEEESREFDEMLAAQYEAQFDESDYWEAYDNALVHSGNWVFSK